MNPDGTIAVPRNARSSPVDGWSPGSLLRELRGRALVPEDSLAVCNVGSVARGWSNHGSDLDFNVVSRNAWKHGEGHGFPVPLVPDRVPTAFFLGHGHRWEIKYWTEGQVSQILAKVAWSRFEEGGTAPDKVLSEAEELFIERCVTGIPMEGDEWIEGRRREIDGSAFRAIVVTRSLTRSDGYVEDALGQLSVDDLPSAVLSARSAFGHAVDALLESHGCYGSSIPKWRARRYGEISTEVLSYDEYWALETMRDYDPTAPGRWVREVISVCRRISSAIEL
ncbi:hypothetical protein ACIRPH_19645 [Nocardiopsis sp. NPDC101807]|uniref:hypothetical protein n=1 Tax=Nocardiopsis sp. NPDC101807 TaxID=3364339 RepID=UPI0038255F40